MANPEKTEKKDVVETKSKTTVPPTPVVGPKKEVPPSITSTMGASLTYPSFFSFFSMVSPFILITLLLFVSIINSNIKGIIYMCGVLIMFFVVVMFQNGLKGFVSNSAKTCKLFEFPIPMYSIPSFNSSLFMFTIVYLLVPMISSGVMNFPLMAILLGLYAVDCVIRTQNGCTTPIGVVLGSIIGLIWGFTWYLMIQYNSPDLLYYDDMISSKQACSRPTKQKFKCSVKKDKLM